MPAELFDTTLGLLILYLFYIDNMLGMMALAGLAGIIGIFSGAIDWVWRQRTPFLPKVIFFLLISAFNLHQHIQYRIWSIFI